MLIRAPGAPLDAALLRFIHPRQRVALGQQLRNVRHAHQLFAARRMVGDLCSRIDEPGLWNGYRVVSNIWTESDVALLRLSADDSGAGLVSRLAWSARARQLLRRQVDVQGELASDLLRESRLLPRTLLHGCNGPAYYTVESALPGTNAQTLSHTTMNRLELVRAAALAIGPLHQTSAKLSTITDLHITQWIREPRIALEHLLGPIPSIDRVACFMEATLNGTRLPIGWIHGDFWLSNVLVDRGEVSGIVDWDLAGQGELATHDLLNLLLSAQSDAEGCSLGDEVVRRLRQPSWEVHESQLLEQQAPYALDSADMARALVLLYWLRYVSTYAAKSPERARNPRWRESNVDAVAAVAGEVLR
jgi:phosphotransferase family enzyme